MSTAGLPMQARDYAAEWKGTVLLRKRKPIKCFSKQKHMYAAANERLNKGSSLIKDQHSGKQILNTYCCMILPVLLRQMRRRNKWEGATGRMQNRPNTEALGRITHQLTEENCLMKSVHWDPIPDWIYQMLAQTFEQLELPFIPQESIPG